MIEQKYVPGRFKRFMHRLDLYRVCVFAVYAFALGCVLADVFIWRP